MSSGELQSSDAAGALNDAGELGRPLQAPAVDPDLPDVDALIRSAVRWSFSSDGKTFQAELEDGSFSQHLARKILSKTDKRLPTILRQVSANSKNSGEALRVTMTFWADQNPLILELAQKSYLTEIHGCQDFMNGLVIKMDATYWELSRHQNGVLYANGAPHRAGITRHSDVMEQHFPGCTKRLACATALGMSPKEAAAYVFSAEPEAPEVLLPDMVCDA